MIGRTKNVQAISKMRMTFDFPSITKMRRSFAIYFLRKIFERYSNIYIFSKDDILIGRYDLIAGIFQVFYFISISHSLKSKADIFNTVCHKMIPFLIL